MDIDFPFKLEFPNESTLNLAYHAHEHFQVCYLLRGACMHYVGEQAYLMTKGDMLAIPPFIPHRFESYQEERVSMVQIDFMPIVLEQDEMLQDTTLFPKIAASPHSQVLVEQLITSMKQEHERQEPGYRQLIKADLIRLLVTIFRESSRTGHERSEPGQAGREKFYEAVRYIDNNYIEQLQLEEVAHLAAMSPTYFSYMFKVLMGQPFVQYVNELRIRKAAQLLQLTNKSVMEVCFDCGFNNVSHFTRTFKKATGLSPLRYRRQGADAT